MTKTDKPAQSTATPEPSLTSASPAEPSSPSDAVPGGVVSRIKALTQESKSVLQVIRNAPPQAPLSPEEESNIQLMKAYIPKLARGLADLMEVSPLLFKGFPFVGAQLRAQEEETRAAEELLAIFNELVIEANAYFAARKSQLARWTLMGVNQVQGYKEMAVPPLEVQDSLRTASALIDSIVTQANAGVQDTKKAHAGLVQKGDQKAAAVTAELAASRLENQVLRGQALSSGAIVAAAPTPPPKKKSPKPKSKTKAKAKTKQKGGAGMVKKKQ